MPIATRSETRIVIVSQVGTRLESSSVRDCAVSGSALEVDGDVDVDVEDSVVLGSVVAEVVGASVKNRVTTSVVEDVAAVRGSLAPV